jgi:hypothetical protein
MNITRDVITDLLPLFYSGDCSSDTKNLVEDYIRENPDFGRQAQAWTKSMLSGSVPKRLDENEEMKALKKTKRLLRLRTFLMVFAILFTLDPFSFSCNEGKTYWLMSQAPTTALVYGILAICFWVAYFVVRRKTRDL